MRILIFILFIFLISCISPKTKTEILETDRKISEKTYQYNPSSSDIKVKFEINGNYLVGKLFLKEKVTYKVSKKEILSFDKKDNFWGGVLGSCFFTLCLNLPFNLYNYYSVKASLGEKKSYEEKEEKKYDFGEFNPTSIPENTFSININDKIEKITDSSFKISLDYFLKRKDEGFHYTILFKEKQEVKLDTVSFDEKSIEGTSPKYKQLLSMIEREEKKREIAEEKEKERASLKEKCNMIQEGYENYYSSSKPSGYRSICHFSCERECKANYSYGSDDFKNCRKECKKLCNKCF